MANAYFDRGWPAALEDLGGPGKRFIVSPYVTDAVHEFGLQAGDRLLLQNRLANFIGGSSDLFAVGELVQQGIEIRTQDSVHAKIYTLMLDRQAVGWIGSANLTRNGRSDGRQIEVMAGPFWLDRSFMNGLEATWNAASVFNTDQVRRDIEDYQSGLLTQDSLAEAIHSVIAVHVRFTAGLGRCTLRADWLGIDTKGESWKGVTFPSVPYLPPKSVGPYRALKAQALESFVDNGGAKLGEGMYLVRTSLKTYFEQHLLELRQQLLNSAQRQFYDLVTLRTEFAQRFNTVSYSFAQERRIEIEDTRRERALKEALQQFDKYMSGHPFELNYSFFAPLLDNSDVRLSEAVKTVLRRPYQQPMFLSMAIDTDNINFT